MFTMEINGKEYELSFGMLFVKEINEKVKVPVQGVAGVFEKRGLSYAIGSIIDGDIEQLCDVILLASKVAKSGLTKDELYKHIEDESTDIDVLFAQVLDFFAQSNCTKRQHKEMTAAIEAEKAKATEQ